MLSAEVLKLDCVYCDAGITRRGMRGSLLSNNQAMYSTDTRPIGSQIVNLPYNNRSLNNCKCLVVDMACLKCGNVIGYHIIHPCLYCSNCSHNGTHNICLIIV